MNKKVLMVLPLLAFAFSGTTMASVYAEEESSYQEESSLEEYSSQEEELTSYQEETSNWQEQLIKIKDTQVLGTTIGAIIGGLASILVSLLTSLLNKANIKEAISTSQLAERHLSVAIATANDVKEKFNITNEQYENAISTLKEAQDKINELNTFVNALKEELNTYNESHKEDVENLLKIIASNKEMVASGLAENLYKLYHRE